MKKKNNSGPLTSSNEHNHHIIIDTPCSVSDMESFLHIVSHEGHWHDAVVKGEDGRIVIEFAVDNNSLL